MGPVQKNKAAQSSGKFTTEAFAVDWGNKQVTCPNGQVTDRWYPRMSSHGVPVVQIRFPASVCRACPDDAWIAGTPRAGTRISRFERLRPAA
ncbi:hypothetical protein GTY41_36440 [Streptomyces sp. SID685]|uniref:hypothetical protein n=1 Tax=Streptomyces TaxID=1883 RepID=UPI0013712B9E|nr:hypothetical protein [Streptomyces sp. SID685]MYR90258.1 hypothetical protein [Streptomyces sp. SID685]